ncbi:2-dehydropantoate 2-reductase [Candidatus Pelagibacter sp.]|nr:2-dehydropantoate 2-reductase [Candidatus Pelagibacter sp.]MDC0908447.1 2-dehydropantoate 2-reductase [Candidatus Pelagibacter sp.]
MINKDLKVAVLGAGAMGCLFGGLLAEKGLNVILIDVWKEHVEAINKKGLKMDGHGGDRFIKVQATTDPSTVGVVDAVIVMCKATVLEPALNSIKNIIGEKTVFMSFQNGFGHEAIMQKIVGVEKVLGGTTTQASNILGPGHIMNHAALPSWIGEYEGGMSERVKEVADTFTAYNLETIAADDVKKRKWMKLFALTAIGPLSAIFDLHHTDLYINNSASDVSRSLGKEIILETRQIALADGVEVSEDECLFMFNKIVDSNQTNKSSMAFDVQYKRKTEIDFISGVVSNLGKKHGIKTPLNDLMYKMIKVKEGMYS